MGPRNLTVAISHLPSSPLVYGSCMARAWLVYGSCVPHVCLMHWVQP